MDRRGVLHSLHDTAKSGFAVLQCGQFIIRNAQEGWSALQSCDYPASESCLQLLATFNVRFMTAVCIY
jgi:hypothetical protein